MKRSLGVTVIAVFTLLGSLLALLMGILTAVFAVVAPLPAQREFPASPAFFKAMLLAASLVYILPAVWGILTSIGLLRLKNWARVSTIVFSVLLILMSIGPLLGSILFSFMPVPSEAADNSVMTVVRVSMGVLGSAQLGIGVWWLLFFTRSRVRQQFVPVSETIVAAQPPSVYAIEAQPVSMAAAGKNSPRGPISVTIIAWLLLIGCPFVPMTLVLHTPAVLFTKVLEGWSADLYYVVVGCLLLYIGVGLLRLKPLALQVGVGYFLFAFVNSAVFFLAPGGRARTLSLVEHQRAMFPWMQAWQGQSAFRFDLTSFIVVGASVGTIFLVAQLYFLVTRREAFETAARARQSFLNSSSA